MITTIKISEELKNKLIIKKGSLTYEEYLTSLLEPKLNITDIKLNEILAILKTKPVVLASLQPKPFVNSALEMDIERDIFKLTRTPKDKLEEAIEQVRGVYDEQVVERIINKVMENKRQYAQEKDKQETSYLS